MASRPGRASSSPARGTRAAGANNGAASPSNPRRASARSPPRLAGSASTTAPAPPDRSPAAGASPASAVPAPATSIEEAASGGSMDSVTLARGSNSDESARRTLPSAIATSAAICRIVPPCARSARARVTTSPVSFEGPFGPRRRGDSSCAPPAAWACQRHNVEVPIPNAAATSPAPAALVRTNCTAARRRPASSPAVQTNVRNPWT